MIALSSRNRGSKQLVNSFLYHAAKCGEFFEPFSGLQNDLQCGLNEVLVSCGPSAHCGLIRESPRSFQSALNRHEPELERKLIGINCAQPQQAPLFKKKQPVGSQLSEGRRTRLTIVEK